MQIKSFVIYQKKNTSNINTIACGPISFNKNISKKIPEKK